MVSGWQSFRFRKLDTGGEPARPMSHGGWPLPPCPRQPSATPPLPKRLLTSTPFPIGLPNSTHPTPHAACGCAPNAPRGLWLRTPRPTRPAAVHPTPHAACGRTQRPTRPAAAHPTPHAACGRAPTPQDLIPCRCCRPPSCIQFSEPELELAKSTLTTSKTPVDYHSSYDFHLTF